MRENIRRILRREPCQCLTAATGEEALAICKSTRVDLVLTDLRVPGTEVAALVREVRALSARAPVLIVTAYVGDDAIAKAMAAGARAVIAKPFTSAQLVTAVQEALKALRG
ncbi:MAG: response regulator [Candidatus Rokubacteria bacterium]|nr:response regulator [Candidatus Rokubacteria bacterium]